MPVSAQWRGDLLMTRLRANAADRLSEAAIALEGGVRQRLTGNRSGRYYRVPGTKKRYQASAPGEAPASRTGTLRTRGIGRKVDALRLEAAVGAKKLGKSSSLPDGYPAALELGTKRMSPRPFLKPTFKAMRGELVQILRKGWDKI